MTRILVLYGTTDGHTAKVARAITAPPEPDGLPWRLSGDPAARPESRSRTRNNRREVPGACDVAAGRAEAGRRCAAVHPLQLGQAVGDEAHCQQGRRRP